MKPQYVDIIPKLLKSNKTVLELLTMKDERGVCEETQKN